jgi:hypothetical protein
MEDTNVNYSAQSPYYSNILQPTNLNQPMKQPESNVSPIMMTSQMAFPEIFYKIQPYIMMVCDQLDAFGSTMPSQEMLDNIVDSIYDDICKRDPNLAEYLRNQEANPAMQSAKPDADPPPYGWRFRRRGIPRDLIEILLLSELFGRRRRYY